MVMNKERYKWKKSIGEQGTWEGGKIKIGMLSSYGLLG
jgi:hypothetical protein